MNIDTNFIEIVNRNAQEQLHGYQESWMSWNGDMTINYRGHCVNNEDIGYQEYHRQHMTEYYIR